MEKIYTARVSEIITIDQLDNLVIAVMDDKEKHKVLTSKGVTVGELGVYHSVNTIIPPGILDCFTNIKKYFNKNGLVKEIKFKNVKSEGLWLTQKEILGVFINLEEYISHCYEKVKVAVTYKHSNNNIPLKNIGKFLSMLPPNVQLNINKIEDSNGIYYSIKTNYFDLSPMLTSKVIPEEIIIREK